MSAKLTCLNCQRLLAELEQLRARWEETQAQLEKAQAQSAWLWVFTNRKVTVYTIDERRSHEVVVLGRRLRGVWVRDPRSEGSDDSR